VIDNETISGNSPSENAEGESSEQNGSADAEAGTAGAIEIKVNEEEREREVPEFDPFAEAPKEEPADEKPALDIPLPKVEEPKEKQQASEMPAQEGQEPEAKAAVPAEAEETQEEEEEAPAEEELDPARAALPWYVVHTYSGYEHVAKKNLEERIRSGSLEPKFGKIMVPQETVVELKRGVKKTSTRKFFPGYMLIQIDLDDEAWHVVKDTPKVTGFVGDARHPSPLSKAEVESLTQQMEGGAARPRPRVHFEEGDAIKVIDGPFTDFNGTVEEVKPDKGKLRVLISIFGRNTPVELDFVQVEKA